MQYFLDRVIHIPQKCIFAEAKLLKKGRFLNIIHYICPKVLFNSKSKYMKINQEYKVREILGENVVVVQGRYGVDMTKVISLNESSLLLWNALYEREFEVKDVVALLMEHYDVDESQASVDAQKWIDSLVKCKLIE